MNEETLMSQDFLDAALELGANFLNPVNVNEVLLYMGLDAEAQFEDVEFAPDPLATHSMTVMQ